MRLGFYAALPASARTAGPVLTGRAALGDWRTDAPGVRRRITAADLPEPFATRSASNSPETVRRPRGMAPHAPPGFEVSLFAEGLQSPRQMRTAPNGDVFVSETYAGRIRVLRARDGSPRAEQVAVYRPGWMRRSGWRSTRRVRTRSFYMSPRATR